MLYLMYTVSLSLFSGHTPWALFLIIHLCVFFRMPIVRQTSFSPSLVLLALEPEKLLKSGLFDAFCALLPRGSQGPSLRRENARAAL